MDKILTPHSWIPIIIGSFPVAFECANCGATVGRRGTDRLDRPEPKWIDALNFPEFCEIYLDATQILHWLVSTLPKCDECDRPATHAFTRGEERWCELHKTRPGESMCFGLIKLGPTEAPPYPRTPALLAAMKLLGMK